MKRIFRITSGCLLILLGLAGLVLPILQGWLFLGLGILILSADVPFVARMICRVEGRFPTLRKVMQKLRFSRAAAGGSPPPCPPDER